MPTEWQTLYILEFKQSSNRNEVFLRVKEDEANEHHKSIIERSKQQPRNGRLNRFILWQGGLVQ